MFTLERVTQDSATIHISGLAPAKAYRLLLNKPELGSNEYTSFAFTTTQINVIETIPIPVIPTPAKVSLAKDVPKFYPIHINNNSDKLRELGSMCVSVHYNSVDPNIDEICQYRIVDTNDSVNWWHNVWLHYNENPQQLLLANLKENTRYLFRVLPRKPNLSENELNQYETYSFVTPRALDNGAKLSVRECVAVNIQPAAATILIYHELLDNDVSVIVRTRKAGADIWANTYRAEIPQDSQNNLLYIAGRRIVYFNAKPSDKPVHYEYQVVSTYNGITQYSAIFSVEIPAAPWIASNMPVTPVTPIPSMPSTPSTTPIPSTPMLSNVIENLTIKNIRVISGMDKVTLAFSGEINEQVVLDYKMMNSSTWKTMNVELYGTTYFVDIKNLRYGLYEFRARAGNSVSKITKFNYP